MTFYRAPAPLPEPFEPWKTIFIAGGISQCPDWQSDICSVLDHDAFDVVNPRRVGDLSKVGGEAEKQIAWEHKALTNSGIAIFWFPKETLCPITLFEYGRMLERSVNGLCQIIVAWHADYQRAFDLTVQTDLAMSQTDALVTVLPDYDRLKDYLTAQFGKE